MATEIQQDELADNVEAATEESAVDQDAALSSTLPTNSTLNDSDEDAEETRRRRGGGLVALSNERAASKDATVKRSSSLALRSSSHGKNQGDNREWTDNE